MLPNPRTKSGYMWPKNKLISFPAIS